MSGPQGASSSRAAEAREEALVAGNDVGDVRGLRRRLPHTPFECPAEQDSVGPREHITESALRGASESDRQNFAKYLKRGPKEYFVLFGRQCFDVRYQHTMPVLNKVLQDPVLKSILLAR